MFVGGSLVLKEEPTVKEELLKVTIDIKSCCCGCSLMKAIVVVGRKVRMEVGVVNQGNRGIAKWTGKS